MSHLRARQRLASLKELQDLASVVRTLNGRGGLKSIELQFQNLELEGGPFRHPPNIEKLMERFLDTTTLRIDNLDFFFYKPTVADCIEKASISSSRRKKLMAQLKKSWGTTHEENFLIAYLSLRECGIKFSSLTGIPMGPCTAHYSSEYCRLRHIFGLADAVHLSLFNMNVNVRFPQKIVRRMVSCQSSPSDPKSFSLNPALSQRSELMKLRSIGQTFKTMSRLGRAIALKGSDNLAYGAIHRRRFGFSGSSRESDPRGRSSVILLRSTTKDRRFRLICHYLHSFPKNKEEKFYVKLIKNTLTDEFSKQLDQERPMIPEGRIDIFPRLTQKRLDKRFRRDRRGKCRFYKNLQESKSLCAPVGKDMILDTYIKHKKSLCRPESEVLPVPEEFLQGLYKYGREVGKFLKKDYQPYKTVFPNSRATVENSRRKGGARAALSGKIEVQKGPLYQSFMEEATRPEPFVIGLFGPPGSGKTTTVSSLTRFLGRSLFPSRKDEAVYSRSCAAKHWDGYSGQPIVVLDDFGQDQNDRSDIVEFEQLVSTNRYILPMAELSDKGTCFTSPIIIVTSNCAFGRPIVGPQCSSVVEDHLAVWRRFHYPIQVLRKAMRDDWMRNSSFDNTSLPSRKVSTSRGPTCYDTLTLRPFMVAWEENWRKKYTHGRRITISNNNYTDHQIRYSDCVEPESFTDDRLELCGNLIESFRSHMDYHNTHLSGEWRQYISCLRVTAKESTLPPIHDVFVEQKTIPWEEEDISISMLFSEFPPPRAPIVEAVAIPEPLKVRMITKAEAETKCLQPLQKSLFRYLQTRPQFVLTHGVNFGQKVEFEDKLEWIYRIENEIKKIQSLKGENDLWLSGDYTAATDNFPISVTNSLIEGILTGIDHEPTKRWVRYEVSPHVIRYPHGLGEGKQTSGQLMGSLLSFPLLCFLNDFIVSYSGFQQGKYLINGDDVVACGSMDSINKWREKAPEVGLSLSLGKNFIDSHFCTVNSQLFYEGDVLHTGKVSLSTRTGKTLSRCYAEMQFYFGRDDALRREFIRRNLLPLRKTVRSLYVPVSLGGISYFDDRDLLSENLLRRSKEVYLHDFTGEFVKSKPVPGYDFLRALSVPTGFFSNQEMILGGGNSISNKILDLLQGLENPENVETEDSDLSQVDLDRRCRLLKTENERLFNQIVSRPFSEFPPLGRLRHRTIFVHKGKVGFIKQRILTLCMSLLLQEIDKKDSKWADWEFNEILHDYLAEEGLLEPESVISTNPEDLEWRSLLGELYLDTEEPSIPEVKEEDTAIDTCHLLPGIEPRIVINDNSPDDLVFLVRGSVTSLGGS